MMDNNTQLAEVWSDEHHQLIIVGNLWWRHYLKGNWFIVYINGEK